MSKRGHTGESAKHHVQHHTQHHSHHNTSHEHTGGSLEEKIVHNLIELQKVHADLADKFNKLSNQLTNLLALFEMTARSFAQQSTSNSLDKDKEFLDKIDKLLDQNKTIAKGLTMMEDKMREKLYGTQSTQPVYQPNSMTQSRPTNLDAPRPLPKI